jgi:hypothetical protein
MTTLAAHPMALGSFGFPCVTIPGASDDAGRIAQSCIELVRRFARSATGNERLQQPLALLEEIYERCRAPNWDSDGAAPIQRAAIRDAQSLLLALPAAFPLPEIFPEGTGAVAFEWYRGRSRRYVATVSGNGTLEFAALAGVGNGVYGELRFTGEVPKLMREHLADLYSE